MNRSTTLAALAILLIVSSAAAQGPRFDAEVAMRGRHGAAMQTQMTRPMRWAPTTGPQRPMPGARAASRPMCGANVDSGLAAELPGVVAGALGLTQEELHDLKADGASIADIAAERGVELATIEAAYLEARDAAIDRLLAEGTIHEFQADQMRARGVEAFANLVAREGQAEGQYVTGERLYANRQADRQPKAFGPPAGRSGRW